MAQRNRAQGWQHAKRSGHENEKLLFELVSADAEMQRRIIKCAHRENATVVSVGYGGLFETDVNCILGGKTKSKADLWLNLSDGTRLNLSIKKDDKGQVFLIGIDRFIDGFEKQYQKDIPGDVKRALRLYFGADPAIPQLIQQYSSKNKVLEMRKHRLMADTLKVYDPLLYQALLDWINENIGELFDYCFARGLASDPQDWAQIIWYRNLLGEHGFDTMLYIPDIRSHIPSTAEYGTQNGGSTIQLPFGFVQWHSPRKVIPGSIQFHHTYKKMLYLK